MSTACPSRDAMAPLPAADAPARTVVREAVEAVGDLRLDGVDVLYGSSPRGPAVHDRLLAALLARLGADGRLPGHGRPATRWRLDHDRLGRPRLVEPRTGAEQDVGVSFAHGPGRSWATVTRGGRVGIDAAEAGDFEPPYPYRRVFTDAELGLVLPQHGGAIQLAAAHLWAVKEAAVKALGCAFHAFDYREVEVVARVPGAGDSLFAVSAGGTSVTAWARCGGATCLALAVPRPPGQRPPASM